MPPLEQNPCPVCQHRSATTYLDAVPDRFDSTAESEFTLKKCLNCSMVYLSPRPPEALSSQYYESEQYLPFSSLNEDPSLTDKIYTVAREYNLRWKQRLVQRFIRQGAILDVGCGTGEFLNTMHTAGWRVKGIERERTAADWGRQHFKLDIVAGTIADLDSQSERFDVITMWHVLEHLYDPVAALRSLHSLIIPGGVLVIAVPNIDGLDAGIYRRHWIALDTPRHVNHFSYSTLKLIGQKNNFDLIWCQQLHLDALFNALMSERLEAQRRNSSAFWWPLRLIRAAMTASGSLLAGSRLLKYQAPKGATLVAVFKSLDPVESAGRGT